MKTSIFICLMIVFGSQLYAQQGWQYQNGNLVNNKYGAICAINKDTVFIIADNGQFLKTADGGTNWDKLSTGSTTPFFDVAFCNGATGFAVGSQGKIIQTNDGGANWNTLVSGTTKALNSIFIVTAYNIWVVGDSGVVLHSGDHGLTWSINNTLTDKRLNSICFRDSVTGFIAGSGGTLLRTSDGGVTWNLTTIATSDDLFSLTVTDQYAYLLSGTVNDYELYADHFFVTNDNIHWTENYCGTPISGPSSMYFQNDSLGFCISSVFTTLGDAGIGISKSTDYGQTWPASLNDWNPPTMVGAYSDIVFVTDSIGYALCGNNILKTIDGGTLVDIKELDDQHYVNLFPNPVTSGEVSLQLKNIDLIGLSIEISDIHGKLVFQRNDLGTMNRIDLSCFDQGVYFVKLIRDHQTIDIEKVVKLQ